MRKIGMLILLEMFSLKVYAQINLVPNGSFEDTVSCPTMGGQVTKCKFWHDVAATPDYYHTCCTTPQFSVPNNTFGFQYPATGDAFMGINVYDLGDTNYREIIGSYLNNQLAIGTKYFVHFKVSFSAGFFQAVNIATNRIGILLSTVDFLINSPPISNFSQVYSDSIISDSLGWTSVRGSFIADSAFTFISIGNFFRNYVTDTINLNPNNRTKGYYYIDDVCLSDDSIFCEQWISSTNLSNSTTIGINVYPNPFQREITINDIPLDCFKLELFDSTGMLFFKKEFKNENKLSLNLGSLSNGIYLLVFYLRHSKITKKLISIKNN